MLADNHKDKVNNPENETKSDKTNDSRNNLAFGKSGNCAANPGSEGDNCQNQAYNVAKAKVIALVCHFENLLLFLLNILYHISSIFSNLLHYLTYFIYLIINSVPFSNSDLH